MSSVLLTSFSSYTHSAEWGQEKMYTNHHQLREPIVDGHAIRILHNPCRRLNCYKQHRSIRRKKWLGCHSICYRETRYNYVYRKAFRGSSIWNNPITKILLLKSRSTLNWRHYCLCHPFTEPTIDRGERYMRRGKETIDQPEDCCGGEP